MLTEKQDIARNARIDMAWLRTLALDNPGAKWADMAFIVANDLERAADALDPPKTKPKD